MQIGSDGSRPFMMSGAHSLAFAWQGTAIFLSLREITVATFGGT